MYRNSRHPRFRRFCWIVVVALLTVPVVAQEPKDLSPGVDLGFGTKSRGTGGPDVYGYTFADQDETTCALQFVDISATGTLIDWGFGGSDDNASDPLALGASFNFYGTDYTELVVSTNGYISTDPTDPGTSLGGGFPDQSMCPLPGSLLSGGGARMYALLDDLVTDTAYVEYFSDCPRPSDRCRAVEDCTIFMWDASYHYNNSAAPFDFEAILYHQTYDIVFQIGSGNPELGTASTTGIQSEPTDPLPPTYPTGAPASGLTYACDTADSISDNTAVCFFHPNSVPDSCVYSDLGITKISDAAAREEPGSQVVYTLAVTNNGPDDARGTQVTDDLDPGVAWVSDDCSAGPPSGSALTWDITNLPVSSLAACNVTVEVTGARGETVENTATVGLDNFDPDTANNTSDTTSFDIGYISDVGIQKVANTPAVIPPGIPVTYTLTATNAGPDAGINTTVTDDLPLGVTYDSNDCGADPPVGTLFTWNLGTVASGTSPVVCNVTVITELFIGEVSNTATIAVDNIDPNAANNSSTDAFTITSSAIFVDNFETGDTSRWSSTVPLP